MRFSFQLEGLLRVRRLLESHARERLDESMMRIRALEHSLAEAARWTQQTADLRTANTFLPAAELQFVESVLRRTQDAITHCRDQRHAEEQHAAELRAAYLHARRERKTIGTLRENALRQFQIEQSRRDQSDLDDIFLGKLVHSRIAKRQAPAGSDSRSESMTGI
jgi:flagellar export protein FliJ